MTRQAGQVRAGPTDQESALPRPRLGMVLVVAGTTVLVLGVLLGHLGGIAELSDGLASARLRLLPAAAALTGVNVVISALKWQIILSSMGYRLPFRRLIAVVLAVWPLALFAPGRANEVLRAWGVRHEVPLSHGVGSVLLDRIVDLHSLCIIAAVASTAVGRWSWSLWCLAVLAVLWAILAMAGVLLWERGLSARPSVNLLRQRLHDILRAAVALKANRGMAARLGLASIVSCFVSMAIIFILLQVTHVSPDPLHVLAAWPLALLAGMLPLTVGGLGTRDAAFLWLLGDLAGPSVAQGMVLFATLSYASITVFLLSVVGLPFMVELIRGSWSQCLGAKE
jgi:glycosyltransferase 2 family protein